LQLGNPELIGADQFARGFGLGVGQLVLNQFGQGDFINHPVVPLAHEELVGIVRMRVNAAVLVPQIQQPLEQHQRRPADDQDQDQPRWCQAKLH